MMKKVLLTGITGQDGANMAEYLLLSPEMKDTVTVYGMARRTSNPNLNNCREFIKNPNFQLVYGDLTDEVSINNLVKEIQPDFFINFAANSFVGCSWDMPIQVMETNSLGVLRCLEAIKKFKPDCRFYSAGSSEEFGNIDYCPQDIKHPIKTRSPYGASKATARHLVKVYRESYNLYAVHGILFNHEGTKRGKEFVTRKITVGVAEIYHKIKQGKSFNPIELGNLNSKRDWSDSEDFVVGVWLMLNQKEPKDYILASGEAHSVGDFVEKAFSAAQIDGEWSEVGEDINGIYVPLPQSRKYFQKKSSNLLVQVNPEYYRPAEVDLLIGDSTSARKELNWQPKISFDRLVKRMVESDIKLIGEEIEKEKKT
jgi:GDPmannose 4,6-dehydratase